MRYLVTLKTAEKPFQIDADKFQCDEDGYTVFYARPSPREKFEEVTRVLTNNVKKIEEVKLQPSIIRTKEFYA